MGLLSLPATNLIDWKCGDGQKIKQENLVIIGQALNKLRCMRSVLVTSSNFVGAVDHTLICA